MQKSPRLDQTCPVGRKIPCIRGLLLVVYETIKISLINLLFFRFDTALFSRFRNIIISSPSDLGHLSGSARLRRNTSQTDSVAMIDLGVTIAVPTLDTESSLNSSLQAPTRCWRVQKHNPPRALLERDTKHDQPKAAAGAKTSGDDVLHNADPIRRLSLAPSQQRMRSGLERSTCPRLRWHRCLPMNVSVTKPGRSEGIRAWRSDPWRAPKPHLSAGRMAFADRAEAKESRHRRRSRAPSCYLTPPPPVTWHAPTVGHTLELTPSPRPSCVEFAHGPSSHRLPDVWECQTEPLCAKNSAERMANTRFRQSPSH